MIQASTGEVAAAASVVAPDATWVGLGESPDVFAEGAEPYDVFDIRLECTSDDVESRFTKDELLTTITIYWVTQTINSSTRLYYETQRQPWELGQDERIETPTGMAVFPKEISRPPREWGERSFNLRRWTEMPSGGHFAALEEPERLVEEIRAFFRPLRG